MKSIDINTEIYEGSFTYIVRNGYDVEKEVEVKWIMELLFKNGQFTGTRIDEQTKDHIKEPITVEGFVDKDLISFIVRYPYCYDIDDNSGEVILIKDELHPGVEYLGHFDRFTRSYEGTWSVELEEQEIGLFQEDRVIESFEGMWKMKKKLHTTTGDTP